jgi:hypothetical protein
MKDKTLRVLDLKSESVRRAIHEATTPNGCTSATRLPITDA